MGFLLMLMLILDILITCGLKNYPQTSIYELIKKQITIEDVKNKTILSFSEIFKYPVSNINI
jgi:lipoate-protein ligase B